MPRFNFNTLALSGAADITKVQENFEEIESKAVLKTDLATTSMDGLMSKTDKSKLNGVESGATNVHLDSIPTKDSSNAAQSGGVYQKLLAKVDKVTGKGLSTNDYTTAEKEKLADIPSAVTSLLTSSDIVCGFYTGNGKSVAGATRVIELNFTPRILLIMRVQLQSLFSASDDIRIIDNEHPVYYGNPVNNKICAEIAENGIQFTTIKSGDDYYNYFNQNNISYSYIAIK